MQEDVLAHKEDLVAAEDVQDLLAPLGGASDCSDAGGVQHHLASLATLQVFSLILQKDQFFLS